MLEKCDVWHNSVARSCANWVNFATAVTYFHCHHLCGMRSLGTFCYSNYLLSMTPPLPYATATLLRPPGSTIPRQISRSFVGLRGRRASSHDGSGGVFRFPLQEDAEKAAGVGSISGKLPDHFPLATRVKGSVAGHKHKTKKGDFWTPRYTKRPLVNPTIPGIYHPYINRIIRVAWRHNETQWTVMFSQHVSRCLTVSLPLAVWSRQLLATRHARVYAAYPIARRLRSNGCASPLPGIGTFFLPNDALLDCLK